MDCFDLQRTRHPIAAKPHSCGGCRQEIAKGDRYEYIFAIYDGDSGTYKTCLPCVEFRSQLKEVFGWEVYPVTDWDAYVSEERDNMTAEDFRTAVNSVDWPDWFPRPLISVEASS